MAGQYNHLQFFRRVPPKYLGLYFKAKEVDLGIDWDKPVKKMPQKIFEAFKLLDETTQTTNETEFLDIDALAWQAGVSALIDEAEFYADSDFATLIAEHDGFHAKVMWVYLEKKDYWHGASMFLHADNVSASFWRKRNDLPKIPPRVS